MSTAADLGFPGFALVPQPKSLYQNSRKKLPDDWAGRAPIPRRSCGKGGEREKREEAELGCHG